MTCPRKFWIHVPISAVLLIFVAIVDFHVIVIPPFPFSWDPIRELLLIGFFLFMMSGFSCVGTLRKNSLLAKLRLLGISALLFSGALYILGKYYPAGTATHSLEESVAVVHFSEPARLLLFLILSVLSAWIFLTFRELIYIQQGKRTERNYRLLTLFIFLYLGYLFFQREAGRWIPNPIEFPYENLDATRVLFYLVGLFAFVNGFRCKWIHYLNKKQKIGVLFFGILITIFISRQILKIPNELSHYSILVGSWIDCLLLFYMIYSSMAILGLLLHLPSAGLVDRRTKEIRSFQNLSATLSSVFDKEELAEKITELSLQIVGADFSWFELKENSSYHFTGTRNLGKEDADRMPEPFLRNVRKEIGQNDTPLLINNVYKDTRTKDIRKWNRKAGSLLATRVRLQKKVLGFIYAVKEEPFGFVEESRGLFQAFADQAAIAIENANLVRITIEQERYREELRLAHEAQMRLLPQKMPKMKAVDICGFCLTANDIGGDFYDVIEVDNDRLDIVVGDVSGKGASAAFYMAELKGAIQTLSKHFSSPKDMLIELNGFLHSHFEPQTFVTMVYGILHPGKKELHYVRAGHPPIGLIRKETLTWIETQGIGLGMASDALFDKTLSAKTVHLKKGDAVVFYTDGLTEARNSRNGEFGEAALKEMLVRLNGLECEELVQQVQKEMESFTEGVPRHDDMTLVIFKIVS